MGNNPTQHPASPVTDNVDMISPLGRITWMRSAIIFVALTTTFTLLTYYYAIFLLPLAVAFLLPTLQIVFSRCIDWWLFPEFDAFEAAKGSKIAGAIIYSSVVLAMAISLLAGVFALAPLGTEQASSGVVVSPTVTSTTSTPQPSNTPTSGSDEAP